MDKRILILTCLILISAILLTACSSDDKSPEPPPATRTPTEVVAETEEVTEPTDPPEDNQFEESDLATPTEDSPEETEPTEEVVETRRIDPSVLPEYAGWGGRGGGGGGYCWREEEGPPYICISGSLYGNIPFSGQDMVMVNGISYPPGEVVQVQVQRPDNKIDTTTATASLGGTWSVYMHVLSSDPIGRYDVTVTSRSGTLSDSFEVPPAEQPSISVVSCETFPPSTQYVPIKHYPEDLVSLVGFQPNEEVLMAIYAGDFDRLGNSLAEYERFALLDTWYVYVDERGTATTSLPPRNIVSVLVLAIGADTPKTFTAWDQNYQTGLEIMISDGYEYFCYRYFETRTSPVAMVIRYWDYVSNGQYEYAWDLLSQSFKERMHSGDYDNYLNGYETRKYCSIDTQDVTLVQDFGDQAVVSARVIYRLGEDCDEYPYDFDITVVLDQNTGEWLYEKTVVREE